MRRFSLFTGIVLFCVFSWKVSGVDPAALFSARSLEALGRNVAAMFPPKLDPEFLQSLGIPILETIAIAFVGISGALAIALPLTFFSIPPHILRSPEDSPRSPAARTVEGAIHYTARSILAVLRTVPELIWALMFVRAIGLGMMPGVMAIAFAYAGVLGKVFAEIIEGVNQAPLAALRATGAGRFKVFFFGVLPQAFPLMLSYALYRFDCALRSSAVLGLVGAGGVGFQIELSIKMMEYGEVLTEILVLFGLVALSDLLSARIRGRSATAKTTRGTSDVKPSRAADSTLGLGFLRPKPQKNLRIWLGLHVSLLIAGALFIGFDPALVAEALQGLGAFFVRAYPPETSGPALVRYLIAGAETIGISFLGTVAALLIALPLATLGARRALVSGDEHLESKARQLERMFWHAASACARLLLNIMRTIPMVIFALIFVPAIGIGPFAGVLAIALHTAGAFGRLYMEMIDEVNPRTLEALRSAGARKAQLLVVAVIPQTLPQISSFFFYRWDVNVRESIILGIVGGGGIGQAIYVSMNLFQEHETYALIIVLLLLVALTDISSAMLRRWMIERSGRRRDPQQLGAEAQLSA